MKRNRDKGSLRRILSYFCIGGIWILGLALGVFVLGEIRSDQLVLYRGLVTASTSVTCTVLIRMIILIASMLLLRYFRFGCMLWVLFISFTYGLLISGICSTFGSAGWLMLLLILAPDALLMALFIYYSFLRFTGPYIVRRKDVLLASVAICAISTVECYLLHPFTAALF